MVRNRKRRTEKGKNFGAIERAAEIVKSEGRPVREVAREFEICHVSLYRYCKKQRDFVEGKIKHPPTIIKNCFNTSWKKRMNVGKRV